MFKQAQLKHINCEIRLRYEENIGEYTQVSVHLTVFYVAISIYALWLQYQMYGHVLKV